MRIASIHIKHRVDVLATTTKGSVVDNCKASRAIVSCVARRYRAWHVDLSSPKSLSSQLRTDRIILSSTMIRVDHENNKRAGEDPDKR